MIDYRTTLAQLPRQPKLLLCDIPWGYDQKVRIMVERGRVIDTHQQVTYPTFKRHEDYVDFFAACWKGSAPDAMLYVWSDWATLPKLFAACGRWKFSQLHTVHRSPPAPGVHILNDTYFIPYFRKRKLLKNPDDYLAQNLGTFGRDKLVNSRKPPEILATIVRHCLVPDATGHYDPADWCDLFTDQHSVSPDLPFWQPEMFETAA